MVPALSILATTDFPSPGTATVVTLLVTSSAFVAGGQNDNVLRSARAEATCEIAMVELLDSVRKTFKREGTRFTMIMSERLPRPSRDGRLAPRPFVLMRLPQATKPLQRNGIAGQDALRAPVVSTEATTKHIRRSMLAYTSVRLGS